MVINDLLQQLGKYIGIDGLSLDKDNICCASFKQGHSIFIEPDCDQQYAHLYSVLGDLPPGPREIFYELVFERNLFGRETGEAAIACDIEQNEVLFCQRINPYELDAEQFIAVVQTFVDQMLVHREWLNSVDSQMSPDSSQELIQAESHFLRV